MAHAISVDSTFCPSHNRDHSRGHLMKSLLQQGFSRRIIGEWAYREERERGLRLELFTIA
jgi:hypothetical protein